MVICDLDDPQKDGCRKGLLWTGPGAPGETHRKRGDRVERRPAGPSSRRATIRHRRAATAQLRGQECRPTMIRVADLPLL
jgi:hypothetical protein